MSEVIYFELVPKDATPRELAQSIRREFQSADERFAVISDDEESDDMEFAVRTRDPDSEAAVTVDFRPVDSGENPYVADLATVEGVVTTHMLERVKADLRRQKIDLLIEAVATAYQAVTGSIRYAYGLDPFAVTMLFEGLEDPPVTAASLNEHRIEGPSWLMLFPSRMIESYGQTFLLNAPAWRAELIGTDGVLLVACSDPTDAGAVETANENLAEYFNHHH